MDSSKSETRAHTNTYEDVEDRSKEPSAMAGQLDYSGATAKTDPLEIKLVKKLDYRIMPTLWAMYFLNYVSSPPITV